MIGPGIYFARIEIVRLWILAYTIFQILRKVHEFQAYGSLPFIRAFGENNFAVKNDRVLDVQRFMPPKSVHKHSTDYMGNDVGFEQSNSRFPLSVHPGRMEYPPMTTKNARSIPSWFSGPLRVVDSSAVHENVKLWLVAAVVITGPLAIDLPLPDEAEPTWGPEPKSCGTISILFLV
ncbi:hypothetical protein BDD12DRAFT_802632 [Trichophaea hybrida]|nr:hypothetical protein BDD12DRAFT_802632 [Trichophaea hybrida]